MLIFIIIYILMVFHRIFKEVFIIKIKYNTLVPTG